MIGITDIGNILYKDCQTFGIDVYQKGNIPSGKVDTERIIIRPKQQNLGIYWKRCFVEVNLCVPDLKDGMENSIRLNELERLAIERLSEVVGNYDGTVYRYSIDSTGTEDDTALKCHYVNVRLLFEVLNVK